MHNKLVCGVVALLTFTACGLETQTPPGPEPEEPCNNAFYECAGSCGNEAEFCCYRPGTRDSYCLDGLACYSDICMAPEDAVELQVNDRAAAMLDAWLEARQCTWSSERGLFVCVPGPKLTCE